MESKDTIGCQIVDSGWHHFNGKYQHCRILVEWGKNGEISSLSRWEEPPEGAPVQPIKFSLFKTYSRKNQIRKRPEPLTPEERRRRHVKSNQEYRRRLREGLVVREPTRTRERAA